jgi:hypothetical protein
MTLSRGWFGFIFKSPEDTLVVLDKLWVIDGNNLMLKCWRVCFDPITNTSSFVIFGCYYPGLPLQLWNAKALQAIGNELGFFIKVDEAAIKVPDKCIRKVLVEIDIHSGLLESIEIDWRGRILGQKLDYLGVPFRCSIYQRTGHLRRDCQGLVVEEESEASMIRKGTSM